jgi:hypothetical protein
MPRRQLAAVPALDHADAPEHRRQIARAVRDLMQKHVRLYDSGELAYSLAGAHTLTHELGGTPQSVDCWLVCQSADGGYAEGEELHASAALAGAGTGVSIVRSATQLAVRLGDTAWSLPRKDTGAAFSVTVASWKLRILARRFPLS